MDGWTEGDWWGDEWTEGGEKGVLEENIPPPSSNAQLYRRQGTYLSR